MPFLAAPLAAWAISAAGVAAASTAAAVITVAANVVVGIAVGAVIGAGMAAIKGTDILQGALSGAAIGGVTAGVFSGVSAAVSAAVGETTDAAVTASADIGSDVATAGETGGTFIENAAAGAKALQPAWQGTEEATQGLMSSVGELSPSSVPVAGGVPQVAAQGANVTEQIPPTIEKELTPSQQFMKSIAEDKKTAMWGQLGSGAAQGLGAVGSEMMKESSAKDINKQAIQDASDLQRRNYSPVPYAIGASPVAMTVNPQAAYQTNVSANAPTANVGQNFAAQTSNQNVGGLLAAQTANVSQPISDWWTTHLQSLVPVPKMATA